MHKKSIIFGLYFLYKYKRDTNKRERFKIMAQLLFSNTVTNAYKDTSEAISDVKLNDNIVVKKTLVEMMRQSFFHGANRYGGYNFIA